MQVQQSIKLNWKRVSERLRAADKQRVGSLPPSVLMRLLNQEMGSGGVTKQQVRQMLTHFGTRGPDGRSNGVNYVNLLQYCGSER